ncbi:Rpn family recombination-promoting nuclease/putative transposase [Arcicella sp. LKC2W]|uniref:Rpn family recombination-promoting nuclease/putative transposase n=1 Tax=Arcicella sp. LKC2W TaxID=2984198 RepID=UPI002B21B141|nr:Rpn family recombination-promoting nuclease/putative transposase [Arcicella sp. LKC2W]MEA5461311.1 Rpn family recombination-promoting nuclease/putative transposase [Arcicella sp. LKC2W]
MLKDKYINPFTDFGFKKLFGTEPNKDLMIDFLNQILPEKHQIKDLTYTKSEYLGNTDRDRKAIFDLYCTSEKGDKFIVEIQKAKQNFFKERSIYYSTFPIQEQAVRGEWDFQLSAVYTVGILDFVFAEDKEEQKVLHVVQLKDQDSEIFYDKLTYIYLEMPNFQKTEEQLETHFDKWLYVFKNLHRLENIPNRLQDKIFKKLFKAAEIAKFSKQEFEQYEDSLKYYRDLTNVTNTAYLEGEKKGKEEGREEGREEGIMEGMKLKNIEIAQKALTENVPINVISVLTGLSEDEIIKLKNNL